MIGTTLGHYRIVELATERSAAATIARRADAAL